MGTESFLAGRFLAGHPQDAASIVEREPSAGAMLLADEGCSVAAAAAVLCSMTLHAAATCLAELPEPRAAAVVAELPLERVVLLVRRIDPEPRERLLAALPPAESASARRLLRYPAGSAGALMDPSVWAFPRGMTVGDAIERLRSHPQHSVYYLYVVNPDGTLAGVLNTRELVLARPDAPVSNAMVTRVSRVAADTRCEEMLANPAWRSFLALPVVDAQDRFIGVVRFATLRALEIDEQAPPVAPQAASSALALAERVWIGLSDLLEAGVGARDEGGSTRGRTR